MSQVTKNPPQKADDHMLARLLGGTEDISVLEKEALLAAVLRGVAVEERRGLVRWRWPMLAAAVSAAAVLVVLFAVPRYQAVDRRAASEFTARGPAEPGPSFRAFCHDGQAEVACHRGGRLLFQVSNAVAKPHFAAFARSASGTIVWYFPGTKDKTSLSIPVHAKAGLLDAAVTIGDEHAAGSYEIYGVFSEAPLGREEIRAFIERNTHSGQSPVVVKQQLEIK